jgi:type IV pilus assembly protein PilV
VLNMNVHRFAPGHRLRIGPSRLMGQRRSHRGFTLLEVLVSILVFSIGVLGLVGLQARATQISIAAEDTNRAALLASEMAALMWNRGTVVIATTDAQRVAWEARVAAPVNGGLPGGAGAITTLPAGAPTPREAEITITWNPLGAVPGAPAQNRYTTTVVIPPN